jgi:uncharacterized protein
MSPSMHDISVPLFVRGLTILAQLLEKGEAHAAQAGLAPETLLGARLADDMFPLTGQIQRASDAAKLAVQRLSAGDGPRFADEETTFAQLQERIAATIAYVESVDAARFEGSADREIRLNWNESGPVFTGASYLLTFALPNFYFHVVTAYDILRNQGVKVGKLDYLGPFGPH